MLSARTTTGVIVDITEDSAGFLLPVGSPALSPRRTRGLLLGAKQGPCGPTGLSNTGLTQKQSERKPLRCHSIRISYRGSGNRADPLQSLRILISSGLPSDGARIKETEPPIPSVRSRWGLCPPVCWPSPRGHRPQRQGRERSNGKSLNINNHQNTSYQYFPILIVGGRRLRRICDWRERSTGTRPTRGQGG